MPIAAVGKSAKRGHHGEDDHRKDQPIFDGCGPLLIRNNLGHTPYHDVYPSLTGQNFCLAQPNYGFKS